MEFKLPQKPKLKKVENCKSDALPPPPWVYPIGGYNQNFSWYFTPFPLAFSLMPSRAISDRKLSRNDLRVLGALCCYTSKLGVCYPNQQTITNKTGISRPNVSKAITRLSHLGYLRYLEPKGRKYKTAFKRGNRYQILVRGNETLPSCNEAIKYF
jgi:DNA-binding MarR family transcriptional regulator